ncbi:MAG: hypothetical protein AAF587_11385 [Bacteroidota bacterium]
MRILIFFLLSLLLIACRFDGDEVYYPVTERGYILGIHPLDGSKEILRIDQQSLHRHWENSWQGLGGKISDMAGQEDRLWLSSGEGNRLIEIDLKTETQVRQIDLPQFSPHYLSIGTTYVLLSDTLSNQVAFLNQKTESLTVLALDHQPGEAMYIAPVFYLLMGQKEIQILHETALAPLGELSLEHPHESLAYDYRNTVICYSRRTEDSVLFQTDIDVNTFQILAPAVQLPFNKVRHSPYRSQNFGKERTNSVRLLTNGNLTPEVFEAVTDFEIDFFESNYYYVRRDSVFRYHIDSQSRSALGAFGGTFHKSFFYIPTPEK